MSRNTIRVAVIKDHPEYRETVEMVLARESDIDLVDDFGSSEGALRRLTEGGGGLGWNVILLDLGLPGIGGLEVLPEFRRAVPDAKVIVLTQSDRESDVLRAINAGAAGYLLKSSTARQIVEGIRTVVAGGATVDPAVARLMMETLKERLPEKELGDLLTVREREVLELIADGLAKKEVADRLGIGVSTVVTHVGHVYEKLEVQNAPAAVAKAFEAGILPKR